MNSNNNGYRLNISFKQYERTMNTLRRYIEILYKIPCDIVSDMSNYEKLGGVSYDIHTMRPETVAVNIAVPDSGIKGSLLHHPGTGIVSDYVFLNHINAFFHEERHIIQNTESVMGNDRFGEEMALSMIAFYGNNDFYMRDHYGEMPVEIDAEFSALKNTYSYIRGLPFLKNLDSGVLDKAMVDFINDRMKRTDHPLNRIHDAFRPYENLNDIWKDIDGDLKKGILSGYERILALPAGRTGSYDAGFLGGSSDDLVAPVFLHCADFNVCLDNAVTIYDKCRVVAAVECSVLHDVQCKYPSLDKKDLSVENVCNLNFGKREEPFIEDIKNRYMLLQQTYERNVYGRYIDDNKQSDGPDY